MCFMCVLLFNIFLFLLSPYLFSLSFVMLLHLIECNYLVICFIYNNIFIYYRVLFRLIPLWLHCFSRLLLCYSLTSWMLFLFFLCPEVFAALVSMITCKVLFINILYIYTFNYLYLKQSFLPYFAAALYFFLSSVRFAFKLFTSTFSYSIADETSFSFSLILFPFSVFCIPSCLPFLSYMGRYSFLFGVLASLCLVLSPY